MTYAEAVKILSEETKQAHDEGCFEVGYCDAIRAAQAARIQIEGDFDRRMRLVDEAEAAVKAHCERYDREQIIPAAAPLES